MLTEIVLATTIEPGDDPLVALATKLDVPYFRGSEFDVLGRYAGAVLAFDPDIVVRLTADCPLLDGSVVDRVVKEFQGTESIDYASNTLERSYPHGLDTEVISREALIRANLEATLLYDREHVTPYLYRHPELFSLLNVKHSSDLSQYRLTVDESPDLKLVTRIYEHFQDYNFSFMEVIDFLNEHPEITQINKHLNQKPGNKSVK